MINIPTLNVIDKEKITAGNNIPFPEKDIC